MERETAIYRTGGLTSNILVLYIVSEVSKNRKRVPIARVYSPANWKDAEVDAMNWRENGGLPIYGKRLAI